jgi:serine/threonine protein kinase
VGTERVAGSQVAGYTIESVLGHGGMGVVYVARQRSPDRRVALKLVAPDVADDDTFRRRFLREATAAAAIDHPHILPVYDAGEAEGVLFIAMRLVDGKDLRAVLREPGPLDLQRVATIVGQIGSALDAAHARGLIHRDVKPANILLSSTTDNDDADFCYLTDFGVSTWMTSSPGTLSSADRMVGSLNYAAPEQIEGTAVAANADMYSLGCVLYECVAGRPPFAGRTSVATLYAQLHETPSPVSSVRPDLPPGLDAVVSRAMAKAPEERYRSSRELTRDLRSALEGRPVAAPALAPPPEPPVQRWRIRSPWAVVVAVVAVVGIVLAGIGLAARGGDGAGSSPPPSSGTAVPQRIKDGVQVTATHTAPSSTDGSGNVVSYLPKNVIDGNVESAWRAPGNGRGERITLLFPGPVSIVRVGLIPGYAKFDPTTGVNRFEQDHIITEVRYLIPGLPPTEQHFKPQPYPQYVRLSATASRITIEIVGTTRAAEKNYTAISEIYVLGDAQ